MPNPTGGVLHPEGQLTVETHRFTTSLIGGPEFGAQWASGGAGIATIATYISTQRLTSQHMQSDGQPDRDPTSNRWWFLTAYEFVDGSDVLSVPDAVKTSGYMPLADVAALSIMFEIVVTTMIPDFRLGVCQGGRGI